MIVILVTNVPNTAVFKKDRTCAGSIGTWRKHSSKIDRRQKKSNFEHTHTWFLTLSSIAASCSTNKVSWRVKLWRACCWHPGSFESCSVLASNFQTCTLDLLPLSSAAFITACGSGEVAPPCVFCSGQVGTARPSPLFPPGLVLHAPPLLSSVTNKWVWAARRWLLLLRLTWDASEDGPGLLVMTKGVGFRALSGWDGWRRISLRIWCLVPASPPLP